jgi:molybdopterin biosynthesis enzyme
MNCSTNLPGDTMKSQLRLVDPLAALDMLLALIPEPTLPRHVPVAEAVGRVLAGTLIAHQPVPQEPLAAWDGWPVAAADTQGAGSYSPVPLPGRLVWAQSGSPLPPGTDAVLPEWAVLQGPPPQAIEPITQGDGVIAPGEDVAVGSVLCQGGQRLHVNCLAALHITGIETVAVREPRVAIICCGDELLARPDRDGLGPFLAALLLNDGALPLPRSLVPDNASAITEALVATAATADLMLLVGGTGAGREDHASDGLAGAGQLLSHGLGCRPGASAGFGLVERTPVVLIPGRWQDAYAAWLLLAQRAVRRLTGTHPAERARARLTRKVASAVGLLDVVPVRWAGPGLVEPLAVGAAPPGVLAAADAALLVPSASEGYDVGAEVELEVL